MKRGGVQAGRDFEKKARLFMKALDGGRGKRINMGSNGMAGVAQLVRAPGCGSGGRRFNSGHSPQVFSLFTIPRKLAP